jgi:hypothetical protein
MNNFFAKVHGHLGRTAIVFIWAAAAFFFLALGSALLGIPNAVNSFRSVSATLAIVFAGILAAFLCMSLVTATVRWIDRHNNPAA